MTATTDPLAVTIFAPEDLRIVEAPLGALQPGFVRIAFRAGGICGSDMHYFRHARTGDFLVTSPLILGHEIAGEIVEINADAPNLSVGDRVAVNPSRWCGHCQYCREDRPNLCENIYFMGSASKTPHMQGGFASRFDAVPAQCVKVPSATPLQAAALAEPLAVCLHAVARAEPVAGRHVAIFGAGPIGLLTMLAARRAGAASLTAFDIAAGPLEVARRLGADRVVDVSAEGATERAAMDLPIDIAFEVSGTPAGLTSAIGAVRRGGVVVQIGNLPGGAISIPANAVMAKEIDLRGSFRFGRELDLAVGLIVSAEIDVLSIVTAEHALTDAVAGFRAALDRSRNIKVMLVAA
jgi:L-idonate 5-dehydrogenase